LEFTSMSIARVVNYDLPQVPEDFVHRVEADRARQALRLVASTFSTPIRAGEIQKDRKRAQRA
jgi:superfamily II DNA/RNA helicase